MATLSILSYNLLQGFKMKNNTGSAATNGSNSNSNASTPSQLCKTFTKITVQNVLSENNANSLNISNNNAIVRKIKDFGMFSNLSNAHQNAGASPTVTVTGRKRALVEDIDKVANVLTKKVKTSKEASTPKTTKKPEQRAKQVGSGLGTPTIKPAGTPGRKGLPLPQAVARRNARERNRVKQVNNGFAALRERIPEEVAEAFEVQGSGRASSKKLSKVETLRMAVEYIRSLERLLGFEFPVGASGFNNTSILDASGLNLVKDEFDDLSTVLDEQFDDSLSNYDVDEYFGNSSGNNSDFLEATPHPVDEVDLMPNITSLNGLQYIRIPGTNTYQLLTHDLFANNSSSPPGQAANDVEQFNTLIDSKCLSPGAPAAAADQHSSPALIAVTPATTNQTTLVAAPASTCNASRTSTPTSMTNTTTAAANGAYVSQTTSSLSRSPVPQASSSPSASSPSLQRYEQRGKCIQTAMLSPAANELLLQTCAVERLCNNGIGNGNDGVAPQFVAPSPHQQLLARLIKQEYCETSDYISTKPMPSPTATTTLTYHQSSDSEQQQQQQSHQLALTISPPLESNIGVTAVSDTLEQFYEQHAQSGAPFYESVAPLKKELGNVLLDASASGSGGLSDESMMDALDWWDAHTPKSDSSSAIL